MPGAWTLTAAMRLARSSAVRSGQTGRQEIGQGAHIGVAGPGRVYRLHGLRWDVVIARGVDQQAAALAHGQDDLARARDAE